MKRILKFIGVLISIPLVSLGYWIFVAILELIPPINQLIKLSDKHLGFTPILLVFPYTFLLLFVSRKVKDLLNRLRKIPLIERNQKAIQICIFLVIFLFIAFLVRNYLRAKEMRHNQVRREFEQLVQKLETFNAEKGRYPTFAEYIEKGDIHPLKYMDCESSGKSEAVLSVPLDPLTIFTMITFSWDRKVPHLIYQTKKRVIKEEKISHKDYPPCLSEEHASKDFDSAIAKLEAFRTKNNRYPLWNEVEPMGISTGFTRKSQFYYDECIPGGGNIVLRMTLAEEEGLYYSKTKKKEFYPLNTNTWKRSSELCKTEGKENFEGGIKAINDFYIQNKRYPTQQEVAKLTVLALPNYAAGNSYLTCFTNGKQYFTLSYSIGGYTSPHEGIDIPAIFNKYSSMTDKIEKSEVPKGAQSLPKLNCP